MRQAGIRIANGVLFTLCCFLLASVFNKISAEFLMAAPAAAPPRYEPDRQEIRTWEERKPILDRNLFGAQITTVAAPPPPSDEPLAATELPLRLLGTVASEQRSRARATIEDKTTRKHEVRRLGDTLESHPEVEVAAIERGRVILWNDGRREELRLNPDQQEALPSPRRRPRRSRSRRSEPKLGELAERLQDLQSDRNFSRAASDLIRQGKFVPTYDDDGQMSGFALSRVKPGGFYDKIGLKDGDIVSAVNGIPLDSAAAGRQALTEFSRADELEIELSDGSVKTLSPEEVIRAIEIK